VKTGAQLITEFEKLAPEEKQIVVDYVVSNGEEVFKETCYSSKIMDEIEHDLEEARQGINVSPELESEEAVNYLKRLRQA
jgi:hypothetical protein